jgi:hypothetical protein
VQNGPEDVQVNIVVAVNQAVPSLAEIVDMGLLLDFVAEIGVVVE